MKNNKAYIFLKIILGMPLFLIFQTIKKISLNISKKNYESFLVTLTLYYLSFITLFVEKEDAIFYIFYFLLAYQIYPLIFITFVPFKNTLYHYKILVSFLQFNITLPFAVLNILNNRIAEEYFFKTDIGYVLEFTIFSSKFNILFNTFLPITILSISFLSLFIIKIFKFSEKFMEILENKNPELTFSDKFNLYNIFYKLNIHLNTHILHLLIYFSNLNKFIIKHSKILIMFYLFFNSLFIFYLIYL